MLSNIKFCNSKPIFGVQGGNDDFAQIANDKM